MNTNHVLQDKYKTQFKLSNITKGDISKYKKLLKENEKELKERYNYILKPLKNKVIALMLNPC